MSSIFTTPIIVPEKICWFLEIPMGTKLTRPDITKKIFEYMKTNNLKTTGHNYKCDEKLAYLFELDNGTEFSMLTLQRYLAKHYNGTFKGGEFKGKSNKKITIVI